MNRLLVSFAALIFAALCLAPVAVMFTRLEWTDFAGLADPRTIGLLGRTLGLGLGAASVAVLLGVPYALISARTDVPGANLFKGIGLVPLVLPPLFVAMTWIDMAPIGGASANIGILGAGTFPIVFLFTSRALGRIDGRLEDAARSVGGTRAILLIQKSLCLPAVLSGAAFAFVFAVNDFSVPDYVQAFGKGDGFNVYADEIFASWKIAKTPGNAVATALPLILLTLAALVPALLLRPKGRLESKGGRFQSPRQFQLGAWRWPACLLLTTIWMLAAGVPLLRMVWEAGGGARGFELSTLSSAFGQAIDSARNDLRNSLLVAAAAASICVPLGLILGHALARSRGGRWFELLILLPLAVPAILFGIGNIVTWNHPLFASFYDGIGFVIVLLAGRFLAFPVLVLSGAVSNLSKDMESAAEVCGAGPARRLFSVVAPNLRNTLCGGWILVFVLALRELDAVILAPGTNHTAVFRVFNAIHFGRDTFVFALALLLVFFLILPGLLWSLFARKRLELLP